MLWSSGLATDWGVQSRLVDYIAQQRRSQLTIVLQGRGYVRSEGGCTLLGPGDLVELDQRRHDDEGYGGSPCAVLVIEWEEGSCFGAEHHGAPRVSRLGPTDVAALSSLTKRMTTTESRLWMAELVGLLRASGLAAPSRFDLEPVEAVHLQRLYGAIATVRTQLPTGPSLTELADHLGLSERHLRRGFAELGELGMTTSRWRECLNDLRMSFAQQLLTVPTLSMKQVARLTGFASPTAFHHAFVARGGGQGPTPLDVARTLRERWR
ncbi:MAG: helix-turn-helix transcriptional regulator [Myxococcales bacterium]|nr:helix-turn-helix transcriptional regulator [Myxococcales bacterium]